jgi:hypothetical protein
VGAIPRLQSIADSCATLFSSSRTSLPTLSLFPPLRLYGNDQIGFVLVAIIPAPLVSALDVRTIICPGSVSVVPDGALPPPPLVIQEGLCCTCLSTLCYDPKCNYFGQAGACLSSCDAP